jgi:hypothetical protein
VLLRDLPFGERRHRIEVRLEIRTPTLYEVTREILALLAIVVG